MPQRKRPSLKDIKECVRIHEIIHELMPGVYVGDIQKRLAKKGIEKTEQRIIDARTLRVKDLDIMQELLAYCQELHPEDFETINTGLVK